jgi:hypothetical protein
MGSTPAAVPRIVPARRLWMPAQHGAWAMLAVPFLVGVAASGPSPAQLVLAVCAVAAYLGSATAQAWLRSRRAPAYLPPLVSYGTVAAVTGLALAVAFPPLLLSLLVIVPAGAVTLGGARPGTRRDLANSLAQVAQAIVLVPAAAYVSGAFDGVAVVRATLVAAAYLVGTVLVVRSVLRERGNPRFAALSVGFHAALVPVAAVTLPAAYAVVAAGLTARAIALPLAQRRMARTTAPLRPVHVGVVEIVASVAVVAVCFLVPV